jgi:hypothetical protein
MIIKIPDLDQIKKTDRETVLAVDIGFAGKGKPTTGLAWMGNGDVETEDISYGELAGRIRDMKHISTIILEAPLYYTFDEDGNPTPRGKFESNNGQRRYWYQQAGLQVAFAALNLIHELMWMDGERTLYIVEGFVSFKDAEDRRLAGESSHTEDAKDLLKNFRKAKCREYEDSKVKNVLNLLGADMAECVVPIVFVGNN